MKLRFVGRLPYIILHKLKNPNGGRGMRINSGEAFEVDPELGFELLKNHKNVFKEVDSLEEEKNLLSVGEKQKVSTPSKVK